MQELSVLRGIIHHMNMDWLFALQNKVKQNLHYSVFIAWHLQKKKNLPNVFVWCRKGWFDGVFICSDAEMYLKSSRGA